MRLQLTFWSVETAQRAIIDGLFNDEQIAAVARAFAEVLRYTAEHDPPDELHMELYGTQVTVSLSASAAQDAVLSTEPGAADLRLKGKAH